MAASPSWYEPAAIDAEHLEWLEQTKEPVLDAEMPIVDVRSLQLLRCILHSASFVNVHLPHAGALHARLHPASSKIRLNMSR